MVPNLQESQGRTSETPRQDAALTHSHVEVERDYHGFHQKLPRIASGVDVIWVIFYRFTKSVNSKPIAESISAEKFDDIYVQEVVVRHGVTVSVVSKRDVHLTTRF